MQSVDLFLLGYDIILYAAVVNLAVLVNLVPVDEETRVCALDISNFLEYTPGIIGHVPCPLWFVWPLHRVPVLLEFFSLWVNDHVHCPCLDCDISCGLFVCTQSYPVLFTLLLVCAGVVICLGGGIFSTWFAMILCPFERLYLVFYLCTSGKLYVLPSYGCGFGDITSMLYGMAWGSIWGGFLFARPGFIAIFVLMFTL